MGGAAAIDMGDHVQPRSAEDTGDTGDTGDTEPQRNRPRNTRAVPRATIADVQVGDTRESPSFGRPRSLWLVLRRQEPSHVPVGIPRSVEASLMSRSTNLTPHRHQDQGQQQILAVQVSG